MDTYNGVCDTKCKVRQLILKPLLEKSTLSTHRKVQNCQVQVLKLRMQKVENSKVKILRSRKVQLSLICLCYLLISLSSFLLFNCCNVGLVGLHITRVYTQLKISNTFWLSMVWWCVFQNIHCGYPNLRFFNIPFGLRLLTSIYVFLWLMMVLNYSIFNTYNVPTINVTLHCHQVIWWAHTCAYQKHLKYSNGSKQLKHL